MNVDSRSSAFDSTRPSFVKTSRCEELQLGSSKDRNAKMNNTDHA